MNHYAGIGSRSCPPPILADMEALAIALHEAGWSLRSGGADGADTAFEDGALSAGAYESGRMQIFLPWAKFNKRGYPFDRIPARAYELAHEHHPAWLRLPLSVRSLMARDVQQVLGPNADPADASKVVICWTPDGAETTTTSKTGGTGMAIRIANAFGVPVVNMQRDGWRERLAVVLAEHGTWVEMPRMVEPRPVSQSFIDGLRAAGAREELCEALEKERKS